MLSGFNSQIDRGSLSLLLKHAYIPDPYTIYEDIFCLEPGNILQVSLNKKEPQIIKYWDHSEVIREAKNNVFEDNPNSAVQRLEDLITKSIKMQMISDVPLGAFLSGGIDSSTIVSLMQAQSSTAIKTFTIGFNEKGFDEAQYAKSIAKHLKTDHTELYVTAEDAMKVIPEMSSIYCEPFADPTQIPNYIVSKLASKDVKVVLSGDGGDELFAGYNRYFHVINLWNNLSNVPLPIRNALSKVIKFTLGNSIYTANASDKIDSFRRKFISGSNVLECKNIDELYNHVISQVQNPEDIVLNGYHKNTKLDYSKPYFGDVDDIELLMATDSINYLPDDILQR